MGSGIFGVPAEIAAEAGTVGAIALLWLAGSAITLCAALSMSELAAMFPRAGGIYVYLREAWGPMPAFVFGWTRLLLIQPAVIGGIALIFAAYVGTLVPLSETGVRVVAAAAIVALGATNARSIAWSAGCASAVRTGFVDRRRDRPDCRAMGLRRLGRTALRGRRGQGPRAQPPPGADRRLAGRRRGLPARQPGVFLLASFVLPCESVSAETLRRHQRATVEAYYRSVRLSSLPGFASVSAPSSMTSSPFTKR